jgi:hypothetical protein
MQLALGQFNKAVMQLHFYLDRDFAPYWKWLPHEFKRRGCSPRMYNQLLAQARASTPGPVGRDPVDLWGAASATAQ